MADSLCRLFCKPRGYDILKIVMSTALMLLSLVLSLSAAEYQQSADRLLDDVIAQFPTNPITVSGKLIVRRRRGIPVAAYKFDLNADWGSTPPTATYRINNSFGQSIEQLKITHGAKTKIEYYAGDPLKPAELKNLSAPIQKTDLSWMDLTLAFLWWRGGKITGEDSIKTVNCYVIEMNAPTTSKDSYASVKLWISKKTHMMMQADGYNAKHKIVRRLWIKSGQKIDGQWVIKDMEIQKYPKAQMTKLRVISMKTTKKKSSDKPQCNETKKNTRTEP